jgi:8-oxo-dGTP diphosphatase
MPVAATEIISRAIIRCDGHVLLAQLRSEEWSFLPGGHVEPGEGVEAALIREIAEELGTEAEIAGFLGVVECGYVEDGTAHHELNFVFDIMIADPEPTSQEDHLEFHWVPRADIMDTDVRPGSLKHALVADETDSVPGAGCLSTSGKWASDQ